MTAVLLDNNHFFSHIKTLSFHDYAFLMQIIYYKKSKTVLVCASALKIYSAVRCNLDKKILLQMTRLFMQNWNLTVSFTITVSLLIHVPYLLYMILISSHYNSSELNIHFYVPSPAITILKLIKIFLLIE